MANGGNSPLFYCYALKVGFADPVREMHFCACRLTMSRQFSKRQRLQILVRDHWTCCYCGEKLQPGPLTHIDHVVPFSHGGRTTVDNGVASCRRCNLLKSASFDHEIT